MRNKEKEKAWADKQYREKYLLAYVALMLVYPTGIEDLDGESWKWIRGYEGIYKISNYGRIKSFPRNGTIKKVKILRPGFNKFGYLIITLSKNDKCKYFRIHRLVAEAFIQNPENKPEVNHKDGNKFNNYYENLEWTTSTENQKHAYNTGLRNPEPYRPNSKLTKEQVRWIREHYIPYDEEYGAAALARKFDMNVNNMRKVIHGKRYKNVE